MRARLPSSRPPVAAINVTPLIDVVLVLLLVFMVLTPLAEKRLLLSLPAPRPEARVIPPAQSPSSELVLRVTSDGQLEVAGQLKTAAEAEDSLRAIFAAQPATILFFDAEGGVSYGSAVQALDLARRAGASTIGLMTDP